MTKSEIKSEIQKTIENIPENLLKDVLDLLKVLQTQPKEKLQMTEHIIHILSEDDNLLKRLAQ